MAKVNKKNKTRQSQKLPKVEDSEEEMNAHMMRDKKKRALKPKK